MRRSPLAPLILLIFPIAAAIPCVAAAANADFDRALEKSRATAESLRSYDVAGTLTITTRLAGQQSPASLEVALRGAARWPDRLLSSQDSQIFNVNVGVGAEKSWFHLGQRNATYIGPPRELARSLDGASQMSMEEEDLFNFYVGIGSFLLNQDLRVEPETGSETLTVDGREIVCQVFRAPAAPEPAQVAAPEGDKVFWFDPETGLVIQASVVSQRQQNGVEMEQELTFRLDRFALNGDVAEEVFSYEPAADEQIVPSLDRVMNPDSLVGEPAPDIVFTDFEGKKSRLSDYRGQVVFLDFWATWCGPCRMEMPHIQTLHDELHEAGDVVFLGASSESAPVIRGWLAKNPYSFPIVMVRQEDMQKKYKVTSIPAGFVIDREGVIRAHLIGAQTESQLRKALSRAGI